VRVVVDASVIVKWVLTDEEDAEPALSLLAQIKSGTLALLQPPHWLAEVAAVITRVRPQIADSVIELLDVMEFPTTGDKAIYQRASKLSRDLNHHLFDTLYHAVALEYECSLISADDTYFRKARKYGWIARLRNWSQDRMESPL
jgi:predicted nucleic acid-binding protein